MKKVLFGVLAAAMLVGTAPIAHAAGETISGGCFLNTDANDTATNGANVGVIGDLSVTQAADGTPVPATIWCKVQVNGSDAPGTEHSYSGTGVQAGTDQISYTTADGDAVTVCERDDINGNTGTYQCFPLDVDAQFPPEEVFTLLDTVFQLLSDLQRDVTDPILCPVLGSLAGTYGVVTITPEGDVLVPDPLDLGLNPLNDCPPYVS